MCYKGPSDKAYSKCILKIILIVLQKIRTFYYAKIRHKSEVRIWSSTLEEVRGSAVKSDTLFKFECVHGQN